MLDHLIFNKLKWFNVTDNQKTVNTGANTYINIKNTFPVDAVLLKDTPAFPQDSDSSNIHIPAGTHVTIKGLSFSKDGKLEDATIVPYQGEWYKLYALDWSNLDINWGGKPSPIRLALRALRHFTRKVALAC